MQHRFSSIAVVAAWFTLFIALLDGIAAARGIDVIEIAPGVHVAQRTEPAGLTTNANSVFIINENDVVVVDSTLTPGSARECIAALRKLTDKRVRFVINTHPHDDHIMGNAAYREAFPDAEFIAHQNTYDYLTGDGLTNRKQAMSKDGYPQFIQFLRGMLESNRNSAGKELSDEERTTYASDIAIAEQYMAEVPNTAIVLPTITMNERLTLHRGERTIEILYLGRGHTSGDIVVHLPKEKIVIAGDLVIAPVPYVGGNQSHPQDWAASLEKLLALKPTTIVPGHGPVMRDDVYVKQMIALFRAIATQVNDAVARNETLEQIRKPIKLKSFQQQFAGESAVRKAIFRNYVLGPGIEAAFKDASPRPPTATTQINGDRK